MCSNKLEKQKADCVSHSSTESEVVSLDAGLRMDGIPSLDLCDLYTKMFESGATEKLPGWKKPHAKISAWSFDMEAHAQKLRGTILRTDKQ